MSSCSPSSALMNVVAHRGSDSSSSMTVALAGDGGTHQSLVVSSGSSSSHVLPESIESSLKAEISVLDMALSCDAMLGAGAMRATGTPAEAVGASVGISGLLIDILKAVPIAPHTRVPLSRV